MQPEDGHKLNRIEELKSKLFSKNYKASGEIRRELSRFQTEDVPEAWAKSKETIENFGGKFFVRTSIFKKFFVFSLFFFGLALAYAGYMFLIEGNTVSSENIDISILGNTFTAGGEELPLQIGITNRNNSPLELVDLIIEYPKSSEGGQVAETERIRESLGTIPAGGIKNENVKVVIFGEQGSVRPIKVSIEYRVEGSNAIFVKDKFYEVNISSTPINISVDAPLYASPNQDISLNVKTSLNSTKPAEKVLLKVDYPLGFQFTKSNPTPSFGNNVWDLGDLAPSAEKNISIEGKMLDVFDGEEKTFRIFSGSQSLADKHVIGTLFNSLSQTVTISKPQIEANLYINGEAKREYSAGSNSKVTAEIRYANNLDTSIRNFEIRAKLTGAALNRSSINTSEGFYNSGTDTITWDRNSVQGFNELNPGEGGNVQFSFSTLPLFSQDGLLSSPNINIEIVALGREDITGYEPADLTNKVSYTVHVVSDVGLAAKALYYSGPFKNTGPIPPKVESMTTYTITWSLSNTANSISKAQIRATLPPWVVFANKSLPQGDITYDENTKEILWNAGNIPKGTGITTAGKEASFQVILTPSLSQVGTTPVLVNDSILTGHDDFANVDVRVNKASLSTRLVNDAQLPAGGERVVQ
jgi:hypothetical protein